MDKNTNDALTHSARIYELTRINNLNLKISYESEKNWKQNSRSDFEKTPKMTFLITMKKHIEKSTMKNSN